jgi:hypothetical protein
MNTFYDRLLEEKIQLSERIVKLNTFLESDKAQSIDPVQLSLLKVQLQAMSTYYLILTERIALL